MEHKIDKSGKVCTLTLDGELTIQHAEALKEALIDALEDVQLCRLNLEAVSRIDLSAIQLIYAAHQSAESTGVQFELTEDPNEIFKLGVETAGYSWKKWFCFGQG